MEKEGTGKILDTTLNVRPIKFTGSAKPSIGAKLKSHFVAYCENTSIHGFCYLPHQMTNLPAKLFWAAVIFTGLVLASLIVNEVSNNMCFDVMVETQLFQAFSEWDLAPTTIQTKLFAMSFRDIQVCYDFVAKVSLAQTTISDANSDHLHQPDV